MLTQYFFLKNSGNRLFLNQPNILNIAIRTIHHETAICSHNADKKMQFYFCFFSGRCSITLVGCFSFQPVILKLFLACMHLLCCPLLLGACCNLVSGGGGPLVLCRVFSLSLELTFRSPADL